MTFCSRNIFFRATVLLVLSLCLVCSGLYATGSEPATAAPDFSGIIKELKAGNQRFTGGKRSYPDQKEATRQELAQKGQHPKVTILTCSDSRVPPEHLFDAGFGSLFVVRVAGNVADTDEIATMEYGTEHLGTPVLLVLGHSKCGAVTAVLKGDHVGGSLPKLVDNILPAVHKVQAAEGTAFSDHALDSAIRENVVQAGRDILSGSAIIRELVEQGRVLMIGGIYHLETGVVEFIDLPKESAVQVFPEQGATGSATHASGDTGAVVGSSTHDVVAGSAAEANTAPVPVLVLVIQILSVLLAMVWYMVWFNGRTRIKRIKFKARILAGGGLYAILVVSPVVAGVSAGVLWLGITGLVVGLIVWGFMMVSLGTLSDHLAVIYKELKSKAASSS